MNLTVEVSNYHMTSAHSVAERHQQAALATDCPHTICTPNVHLPL